MEFFSISLKVVKWYFSPIELWLLWPIEQSGNENLVPAHWPFLSCSWYQMKLCVPNFVKSMKQTIQNTEVCSRERFISGQSKKNGLLMLIKPQTSWWFLGRRFYRQNWGWGLPSVWLSSDWLTMKQEGSVPGSLWSLCIQHPPPGWEPYFLQRNSKTDTYIPCGRSRILLESLHYNFFT